MICSIHQIYMIYYMNRRKKNKMKEEEKQVSFSLNELREIIFNAVEKVLGYKSERLRLTNEQLQNEEDNEKKIISEKELKIAITKGMKDAIKELDVFKTLKGETK